MMMRAETIYDYEACRDLIRFSSFRGKHYKLGPILLLIIEGVAIGLSLFSLISFGSDPISWGMLVCMAFLGLIFACIYFLLPRIAYKAAKATANSVQEIILEDETFSVASTGAIYTGTTKAKYSLLVKVYETDKISIYTRTKPRLSS